MTILKLAKRVKRGVRLLDKKVPNWRTVLRRHKDGFNFADGDYCVLGTLEHHSGLKRLGKSTENHTFTRAAERLKLGQTASGYGFDGTLVHEANELPYTEQVKVLDALWRAEFER